MAHAATLEVPVACTWVIPRPGSLGDFAPSERPLVNDNTLV
jgi:hypothetical protein